MKLLLTSAGFTNIVIVNALRELTERPFEDLSLAFIPTAANVEAGDKDWLIDDLHRTKDLIFKQIDIVDISAVPQDNWQPRLEAADILMFGGGNTFHLMNWIKKSGLATLLPEWLKTKICVGISAGSMVTAKKLDLTLWSTFYGETVGELSDDNGLGLVDFQIIPHLNSDWFTNIREDKLAEALKDVADTVYAIDDNTAIKVEEGNVTVVGEGEWRRFN